MAAELYCFYLGLDLGKTRDYTAIAVVEEPLWDGEGGAGDWIDPSQASPTRVYELLSDAYKNGRPSNPSLHVRHLERLPLGTSYPDVVSYVKGLLQRQPLSARPTALLVDRTGVGTAIVDDLLFAGASPIAIHFTAGATVTPSREPWGFNVPTADLIAPAQVLAQNKRLKVASHLRFAATLRSELAHFHVKQNKRTGNETYEHWREGDHDDLVYAVAMAVWFRTYWNRHLEIYYSARENNPPKPADEPRKVTYRAPIEKVWDDGLERFSFQRKEFGG